MVITWRIIQEMKNYNFDLLNLSISRKLKSTKWSFFLFIAFILALYVLKIEEKPERNILAHLFEVWKLVERSENFENQWTKYIYVFCYLTPIFYCYFSFWEQKDFFGVGKITFSFRDNAEAVLIKLLFQFPTFQILCWPVRKADLKNQIFNEIQWFSMNENLLEEYKLYFSILKKYSWAYLKNGCKKPRQLFFFSILIFCILGKSYSTWSL